MSEQPTLLSAQRAKRVSRTRRLLVAPLTGAEPTPVITVEVFGLPRPQGSITAWVDKDGRQRVKQAGTLHEWRGAVTVATRAAWEGPPLDGPLMATIMFELPRPKGHYGTGRNAGTLRPAAPMYPATMPDLDKLIRAILDSITMAGCVWFDDAQVVRIIATKLFAERPSVPGCHITICRATT